MPLLETHGEDDDEGNCSQTYSDNEPSRNVKCQGGFQMVNYGDCEDRWHFSRVINQTNVSSPSKHEFPIILNFPQPNL